MVIQDIENAIFKIIGKKISIQNTESKITDLGVDSLDFLEIVVELENKAGVTFPDDYIFKCITVGDLLDMVNKPQQ